MHAELARLIGARGHDAALVGVAAHNEGEAPPLWVVEHLHRGEERVEVEKPHRSALPCCVYVRSNLFHALSIRRAQDTSGFGMLSRFSSCLWLRGSPCGGEP